MTKKIQCIVNLCARIYIYYTKHISCTFSVIKWQILKFTVETLIPLHWHKNNLYIKHISILNTHTHFSTYALFFFFYYLVYHREHFCRSTGPALSAVWRGHVVGHWLPLRQIAMSRSCSGYCPHGILSTSQACGMKQVNSSFIKMCRHFVLWYYTSYNFWSNLYPCSKSFITTL